MKLMGEHNGIPIELRGNRFYVTIPNKKERGFSTLAELKKHLITIKTIRTRVIYERRIERVLIQPNGQIFILNDGGGKICKYVDKNKCYKVTKESLRLLGLSLSLKAELDKIEEQMFHQPLITG